MKSGLKYVNLNDELYNQAKKVRINCFFLEMDNSEELINDEFEKNAIHIVFLNTNKQVIGTGRLHTVNSTGIISQMAVSKENQKAGIGKKILNELICKCWSTGITQIELSARETAIEFYQKSGFTVFGNKYPSQKTGIIHQKMSLTVNNAG